MYQFFLRMVSDAWRLHPIPCFARSMHTVVHIRDETTDHCPVILLTAAQPYLSKGHAVTYQQWSQR